MKFEDDSQNLRLRLRIIQILVILLLAVLSVRLYVLQVMNGAYYAEKAENQPAHPAGTRPRKRPTTLSRRVRSNGRRSVAPVRSSSFARCHHMRKRSIQGWVA